MTRTGFQLEAAEVKDVMAIARTMQTDIPRGNRMVLDLRGKAGLDRIPRLRKTAMVLAGRCFRRDRFTHYVALRNIEEDL